MKRLAKPLIIGEGLSYQFPSRGNLPENFVMPHWKNKESLIERWLIAISI